jgi:hypothetical protein
MWPKAGWLEVGAVLSFPTYEENQTRIITLNRKGKLPHNSRVNHELNYFTKTLPTL